LGPSASQRTGRLSERAGIVVLLGALGYDDKEVPQQRVDEP
jgi:hypothetical protein